MHLYRPLTQYLNNYSWEMDYGGLFSISNTQKIRFFFYREFRGILYLHKCAQFHKRNVNECSDFVRNVF